jgi:hypothetical protein
VLENTVSNHFNWSQGQLKASHYLLENRVSRKIAQHANRTSVNNVASQLGS